MITKSKIYAKLKSFVTTPYGLWMMGGLCFLESCISPISPIVMLLPLLMLHKGKTLRYVNIATICALLGSIIGYLMGYYLMLYIEPFIESMDYAGEFLQVQDWFGDYGLLMLLPASILPFPPFKLFTIAAGAMQVEFGRFLLAVIVVRWIHFMLVPILLHFGQKAYLLKYTNKLSAENS